MKPDNNHFLRCLESLKESFFFQDIENNSLRTLLGFMKLERWCAGEFKNSLEAATHFHVIVSGRMKIYHCNLKTGREHTIFILSRGDVFDIIQFMDSRPHEVYWEPLDEMELLSLPIRDMKEWMLSNTMIYNRIMLYLGERLRQIEHIRTDISLYTTLVRLAHLLLQNINNQTHELEKINKLPNEEIASLLGTTRAVVNRHIQELKKCGAISVKRGDITIENVELLMAVAEEKLIP